MKLSFDFREYMQEWLKLPQDAPRIVATPGSELSGINNGVQRGFLIRPFLVGGYIWTTVSLHDNVRQKIGFLRVAGQKMGLPGNVTVIGRGLAHSDLEKFVWSGTADEFALNWSRDPNG